MNYSINEVRSRPLCHASLVCLTVTMMTICWAAGLVGQVKFNRDLSEKQAI